MRHGGIIEKLNLVKPNISKTYGEYMNKYRIFLLIIDQGSLSKAALISHYTQSALSQMLNGLEKELGVTLLNRTHTGVSLTAEGQQLLPQIRQLSQAFNSLNNAASQLSALDRGVIRIGTFSSISTALLAPTITRFTHRYPNVEFELYQGDYAKIERWLTSHTIDFGFLALPINSQFHAIPILNDEMVAILPQDHPLADHMMISSAAFSDEPLIILNEGQKHGVVLPYLKQQGVSPYIKFISEDDYTILSMVEQHLGLSILAKLVTQHSTYHFVTRSLNPPLERQLAIAYPKNVTQSYATQAFIKTIQTFIQSHPHWAE